MRGAPRIISTRDRRPFAQGQVGQVSGKELCLEELSKCCQWSSLSIQNHARATACCQHALCVPPERTLPKKTFVADARYVYEDEGVGGEQRGSHVRCIVDLSMVTADDQGDDDAGRSGLHGACHARRGPRSCLSAARRRRRRQQQQRRRELDRSPTGM